MVRVSREDYARAVAAARARKDKRAEKAAVLWAGKPRPQKTGKIRNLEKASTIKAQIVRLLGLLDRKKHGPACRLMPECPNKKYHFGTLAYHIVPAQRGDATRFFTENVVWACRQANYGEVMNRSLYREKHIKVFGRERVERLEALAREIRHYTRAELLELREKLKQELRGTMIGGNSTESPCPK